MATNCQNVLKTIPHLERRSVNRLDLHFFEIFTIIFNRITTKLKIIVNRNCVIYIYIGILIPFHPINLESNKRSEIQSTRYKMVQKKKRGIFSFSDWTEISGRKVVK